MILQRPPVCQLFFIFLLFFIAARDDTHTHTLTNPLTCGWWEDARKPPPERAEDCVQSVEAAMMSESRQQKVLWFHTLAGEMKKHDLGPVRLQCLWAPSAFAQSTTHWGPISPVSLSGWNHQRQTTDHPEIRPPPRASPPLAADSLQVLSLAAPTVWTLISAKLPRPNPVSCDTS